MVILVVLLVTTFKKRSKNLKKIKLEIEKVEKLVAKFQYEKELVIHIKILKQALNRELLF